MTEHFELLKGPPGGKVTQAWFTDIAELLINRTELVVSGGASRFREVELYYFGEEHPDPFAHRDPLQLSCLRWYFHREGGSYKGGSFKGVDISFGSQSCYGGVLIRTIHPTEGQMINGPSLSVDHMLARTGFDDVASLDSAIGGRFVHDDSSPLWLRPLAEPVGSTVLATARVGLTLKKMSKNPKMPRYIMRPYRFLDEPRIKKGKVHTVIALYQAGWSVDEIRSLTRSPLKSILGYIEAYQAGLEIEDFGEFEGASLRTADLCRLHGALARGLWPALRRRPYPGATLGSSSTHTS